MKGLRCRRPCGPQTGPARAGGTVGKSPPDGGKRKSWDGWPLTCNAVYYPRPRYALGTLISAASITRFLRLAAGIPRRPIHSRDTGPPVPAPLSSTLPIQPPKGGFTMLRSSGVPQIYAKKARFKVSMAAFSERGGRYLEISAARC